MSGLSKTATAQEIDTYVSLMGLIKDIQGVIKNPPDLKKSFEESLAIIAQAKEEMDYLDKQRASFKTEENNAKAILNAREKDLNDHANDLADLKKSLDSKHVEIRAHAKNAEDRHTSLNIRENAVASREAIMEKRESEVKALKEKISSREFALEERAKVISAKEDKIRQALG